MNQNDNVGANSVRQKNRNHTNSLDNYNYSDVNTGSSDNKCSDKWRVI